MLRVNSNTVLRALRILREEGIVTFSRGRGVTVAVAPDRSQLINACHHLIRLAAAQGYQREELARLIASLD